MNNPEALHTVLPIDHGRYEAGWARYLDECEEEAYRTLTTPRAAKDGDNGKSISDWKREIIMQERANGR